MPYGIFPSFSLCSLVIFGFFIWVPVLKLMEYSFQSPPCGLAHLMIPPPKLPENEKRSREKVVPDPQVVVLAPVDVVV